MPNEWLPILLTAFLSAAVLFGAWLGKRVVDMGGLLIGMQKDIKSLLDTRTDQKAEKLAGTEKRLNDLERKK